MKLGPNQLKWIRALRSGKFRKGRGQLCKNGRYCCLGVACKIFMPETADKVEYGVVFFDGERYSLSNRMMKLLGLRSRYGSPDIDEYEECDLRDLASLNDSLRKSHKEIADILVKYKDYYFVKSC